MVCKAQSLHRFLSLGSTPLANAFLKKEDINLSEPSYPLEVLFCNTCSLVQLNYTVSSELMFKNYVYVSSTSDALREHFRGLAEEAVKLFIKSKDDLIIDIGSNDGTLLKEFKKFNVRVLGVEPATNIAKIANSEGIETINKFFNESVATKILEEKGNTRIITATNVFAHVADLDGFVKGVYKLLDDYGVFIVETPYLVDLIQNTEFDTIYHEHLRYYSIQPLKILFERHNMKIFDVKRVPVHGGTIRVFIKRDTNHEFEEKSSVKEFIYLEKGLKLYSVERYLEFAKNVENIKRDLLDLLKLLKSEGKHIVGYGAAAKGNTLLNYCKIDTNLLDYIVDKNPHKQSLFAPGTHIPVFPPEKLLEDKPDYMLILAWNFADEIIKQQKGFKDAGGKFIIPIPKPKIV